MEKNAVIYVRGATKKGRKLQEAECRDYARANGVNVQKVFWERSNRRRMTLKERKALWRMNAYCFHEDIGFILVFRERDLARNSSERYLIDRLFRSCEIKIVVLIPLK